MSLFNVQIYDWNDWEKIRQSIPVFSPLVEHIFAKENLPLQRIQNLTPGTNAVFRTGDYVIKVFVPTVRGIDQTLELQTELFANERVSRTGISAPKMVAHGYVEDRYRFNYIITEYIEGVKFPDAVKNMTGAEKTGIGQELRNVTDKLNTPCEPFNNIDVIKDQSRQLRWVRYTDRFKGERAAYIQSHDYGEKVFVHGDLYGNNIILTTLGELCIIDFAEAVLAPLVYEHAYMAAELFEFDPALLRGYFGGCSKGELADICFNGLLIHDFGGDVVERHIGNPGEFQCLNDMRKRLYQKIVKRVWQL